MQLVEFILGNRYKGSRMDSGVSYSISRPGEHNAVVEASGVERGDAARERERESFHSDETRREATSDKRGDEASEAERGVAAAGSWKHRSEANDNEMKEKATR